MAGGRPTKYKPEYPEMLIEHMSRGGSYEAFAGHPEVRVNIDTLYEWEKVHEEFSEAKRIGWAASQYHWEEIGTMNVHTPPGQWSQTAWMFILKCRFRYRDGGENAAPKKELEEQNEKLAAITKQFESILNKK